jgi:WD40 repeat protein
MVYAPDGKTIATVNLSNNTIELWSPGTGKHKATFKHANTGPEYDISSVVYSPDGNTIAAVGGHYKDHKGTVYLWHAQTMKRKIIYEGPDYISSVAYSPDGRTIATGSWNSKIQVWHTVTGEELKAIPTKHIGGVESLAYSSDGKTIATGGGYRDDIVQLWDATTGEHKTRLTGHTKTVSSVVYSPDGKTIASGSTDGTVRFWDAITSEHKATFTAHTDIVSVVYSPDGQTLATRSTDGTVILWEIKPTLEAE